MGTVSSMAIASVETHTLLLGGGYTLGRLAALLPQSSFVITSRSPEQCHQWRSKGWNAACLDITDINSIRSVFALYPALREIIDSVPPLRGVEDPAFGVRAVLSVASGIDIKRIIYLSTTGVFGVRDGSWVDESTPEAPWNPLGEARYLCEQAYRKSGVPFTALRLPAIYGPDRGIGIALRSGSYRLVGDGSNWTNRIHVEDLVKILLRSLAAQELPDSLCVSDDTPAQSKEVVRFFCERMGLPLPECVSEEEILARGAYTMLSNQRIRNSKMKSILGLALEFPSYVEGFDSGAS